MNTEELLITAEKALDKLGCQAAYKILEPLLKRRDSGALYLYSRFSISENETEDAFEKRSIQMLKESAEAGYLPAIYSLASCYEVGDLVEADANYAATLFQDAADKGYSKAKFSHGLNLYYGSHGILQSEEDGLHLIKAASNEGVEDAKAFLKDQGLV